MKNKYCIIYCTNKKSIKVEFNNKELINPLHELILDEIQLKNFLNNIDNYILDVKNYDNYDYMNQYIYIDDSFYQSTKTFEHFELILHLNINNNLLQKDTYEFIKNDKLILIHESMFENKKELFFKNVPLHLANEDIGEDIIEYKPLIEQIDKACKNPFIIEKIDNVTNFYDFLLA